MASFKDLIIWQKSLELYKVISEKCQKFPQNRVAYNLMDQVLRSTGSMSANIAEGYGRGGDKEFIRYLIIAKGSLDETIDWLYKALALNYITKVELIALEEKLNDIRKMICVFISKIKKRI